MDSLIFGIVCLNALNPSLVMTHSPWMDAFNDNNVDIVKSWCGHCQMEGSWWILLSWMWGIRILMTVLSKSIFSSWRLSVFLGQFLMNCLFLPWWISHGWLILVMSRWGYHCILKEKWFIAYDQMFFCLFLAPMFSYFLLPNPPMGFELVTFTCRVPWQYTHHWLFYASWDAYDQMLMMMILIFFLVL